MSTLETFIIWLISLGASVTLFTISIRKISIHSKTGQKVVRQKIKDANNSTNLQAGNDITIQDSHDSK